MQNKLTPILFWKHTKTVVLGLLCWLISQTILAQITVEPNLNTQQFNADELVQISFSMPENSADKNFILVWNGRFSSQVITASSTQNNSLVFAVPAFLRRQSGATSVALVAQSQTLYSAQFYIAATQAIGVIDAFVGPKTVNVDTLQPALVINIAKDVFKNPLENGEKILFQAQFPQQKQLKQEQEVQNLVSFLNIQPPKEPGKIIIGSSIAPAHSKEQEINIESGLPMPFTIYVKDKFPYADERQQTIIRSDILKDKNQNIVADGTNVEFIFDFLGKKNTYKSFTVNGVATVAIQNPKQAGTYAIEALVYPNVYSNTLPINFESAVQEIIANYQNNTIQVGPISSILGQYYTNGTNVEIELNPGKFIYHQRLNNGYANLELPQNEWTNATQKQCTVRIAGKEKTILIP